MDSYKNLREEIDRIDDELLLLLNKRAGVGKRLAKLKQYSGDAAHQPQRELEVLRRVRTENAGPLSAEAMEQIFKAIIEQIRGVQLL